MKSLFKEVLFLCLLLGPAYGADPYDQCTIKGEQGITIDDFNAELGRVWTVKAWSKTGRAFGTLLKERGFTCPTVEFSEQDGTVSMTLSAKDSNSAKKTNVIKGKIEEDEYWAIYFEGSGAAMSVLGTDGENWAIVDTCDPAAYNGSLWVMLSDGEDLDDYLDEISEIYDENEIDPQDLVAPKCEN